MDNDKVNTEHLKTLINTLIWETCPGVMRMDKAERLACELLKLIESEYNASMPRESPARVLPE